MTSQELLDYKEPEKDTGFMSYSGDEKGSFTLNDLDQDHNFSIINTQMNERFGYNEDTHGRQKVIDKWVNYNRNLTVGNTISVLTEAAYLNAGFSSGNEDTDKISQEKRQVNTLNSYKLWDNMKSGFSSGDTAQKIDYLVDYGRAIIADPMNLIGFGAGKLLAGSAAKITSKASREVLKMSVDKILAKNKIKVGTARADLPPKVLAEINKAEARLTAHVLRGDAPAKFADDAAVQAKFTDELGKATTQVSEELGKQTKRSLKYGFGVEAAGGITIDAIQQNTLMQVDFQDEYSYINAPLIATMGVVGYGVTSLLPNIKGNVLPQSMAYNMYDNIAMASAAFKKNQLKIGAKSNKKVIKDLLGDKNKLDALEQELKLNNAAALRWAKTVKLGKAKSKDAKNDNNDAEGLKGFILGNQKQGEENFDGLQQIFDRYDIKLQYENDSFVHLSDFITATVKSLPAKSKVRKEIETLYNSTLKTLDSEHAGSKNLAAGMDILANQASTAGKRFSVLGHLAKTAKEINGRKATLGLGDDSNITVAEMLDDELGQSLSFMEKGTGFAKKAQNNFIKVLVTHPGTSSLNLMGWVNASMMQSGSDVIKGVLYGGRAVVDTLAKKDMTAEGAVDFAELSRHMFSLQHQKIKNLMNPYATKQEALSFLSENPALQKDLFRYIAGAIDNKDVAKYLGVGVEDLEKTGVTDKYIDFFQNVYGVKAIDVMSKTQEFMYNIDKQIRMKYGVTYKQFMSETVDMTDAAGRKIKVKGGPDEGPKFKQEPKHWKKMGGNDYYDIQRAAVDDSLRNVFSKSFGGGDFKKDRSTIESAAKIVEDFRGIPGIGAMIPFGQFFNNTISFMADYSPVSLIYRNFVKKEDKRDLMELYTKAAVGMTFIGYSMQAERKNMEEGLEWHQERDQDGQVRSRLYDFPFSFYKGAGRLAAEAVYGQGIPPEMYGEFVKTFGVGNLTRTLGDTSQGVFDMFEDIATNESGEVLEAFKTAMGSTVSLYASGFSRPLDPINQIAAMSMGTAYNETDRKIGGKYLKSSTRYVESIFDALANIGEGDNITKPKYTAQRATESSNRGVPIGRIFGYRVDAPPTALDKVLGAIGRPKWKETMNSDIPEANNTMNRLITTNLQAYAARVLADPKWEEADIELKTEMYNKQVRGRAKEKTMLDIYRGGNTDDRRHRLLFKLTQRGSGVKLNDLEDYLEEMGIDKEVVDLNYTEILNLKALVEDKKIDKRVTVRTTGI